VYQEECGLTPIQFWLSKYRADIKPLEYLLREESNNRIKGDELKYLSAVAKTQARQYYGAPKYRDCHPGVYQRLIEAGATYYLKDFEILRNYLRLHSRFYRGETIDLATLKSFVTA
jgi:hypothetical protein